MPQVNQSQAPKSNKRKLALGNPMSLLMRRRSTQALERLSDESLISTSSRGPAIPPLPENYDPRIRGNIVHDFSAPRPKRNFSSGDIDSQERAQYISPSWTGSTPKAEDESIARRPISADRYSPVNHERAHTPVFHENFEEEANPRPRDSAIRAEELANSGFLARNANLISDEEFLTGPSFQAGPSLPSPPTVQEPHLHKGKDEAAPTSLAPQLPTVAEANPVNSPIPQDTIASRSPPKTRSRAPSATESAFQPTRQPKHHTSNASRFSFQMMDTDSIAQEKLLEDKHRQQAARKQQLQQPSELSDPYDDGMDHMEDYDEMDDDGLYEEAIPGVNADAGDENIEQAPRSSSLAALGISLSNVALGGQITPISAHSGVQKPFPEQPNEYALARQAPTETDHHEVDIACRAPASAPGLPIQRNELSAIGELDEGDRHNAEDESHTQQPKAFGFGDDTADEMYFDDGMIDEPDISDDEKFDESVFDDPSHPLYERKPISGDSVNHSGVLVPDIRQNLPLEPVEEESAGPVEGSTTSEKLQRDRDSLNVPHNSIKEHRRKDSHDRRPSGPWSPSKDLAAYHSALAEAAQKAAADGKFARHERVHSDVSDDMAETDDGLGHSSRPSLVPDDGRFSQDSNVFTPSVLPSVARKGVEEPDYEASDLDDYLEDDPIIAAANAEALASDDEGFYGQEFGFYAQAHGANEVELVNGGYFGPRGIDALGRSTSGRNAVREPNLTPITERSEFSTRNSFISLHSHWGPPSAASAAMPSPGLAQLARLSPYAVDDDEMSLSQLMKLRRGAFGGSNSSLHSAGNYSPNYPSPIGAGYSAANFAGKGSSPMAPSSSAPGMLGLGYGSTEGRSPATTSHHGSSSLHGESPLALADSSDPDFDPADSPSPSPLTRSGSPTVSVSVSSHMPSSSPRAPASEAPDPVSASARDRDSRVVAELSSPSSPKAPTTVIPYSLAV
ncbi:MAG: hypothetical protein M1822_002866 [Bathelium mastoideum]|nr:MAG: hypothetical protein M1822_002866 [Bathelium mastoideum]